MGELVYRSTSLSETKEHSPGASPFSLGPKDWAKTFETKNTHLARKSSVAAGIRTC